MFALDSALGRGFGVVLSVALASLLSGCAVSEASVPALKSSEVVVVQPSESIETTAPELVPEPATLIAQPVVETPVRCLGPEPTGRWANRSSDDDWARGLYEAAKPHSAGTAYVNFMPEDESDRVEAAYGGNYRRLVEAKLKYDPTNLFRMNQNVRPKAGMRAA